ncbi:MAG: response regulator [Acidobacteria bacterium]|nr:response regulator [Acidobacteriota bacterium]
MKGTRILLVDDFEDAREMYMTYLEFEGFEVLTAGTAVEAIQRAIAESPDLILMDAGLPGMTGWDAIVELKGDDRTRNIPVLMLTGHVLKESQERAAEAGADGFIPKPCLPDELSREIRHALKSRGRRSGETEKEQQNRTRTASADTRARLRRARARKEKP